MHITLSPGPLLLNLFLEALHVVSYAKLNLLEVIVAASRACMQNPAKSQFFFKRSKSTKSDHAFLPKGIQIEDLTQASYHA